MGVLLPIMEARLAKCVAAGFDGVEWDNLDGYTNNTGFKLSAAQQIAYNIALANMAHAHGLSVALKNDLDQVESLAAYFDYAVNEQCQQFSECQSLDPFLKAGKAVFQVEYVLASSKFCGAANKAGRSGIKKTFDLYAAPYLPCE